MMIGNAMPQLLAWLLEHRYAAGVLGASLLAAGVQSVCARHGWLHPAADQSKEPLPHAK